MENELQLGRTLNDYKQNTAQNSETRGENKKEKIPMILIVVQGGPRTLQTVKESIDKDVPVLVLAVSL